MNTSASETIPDLRWVLRYSAVAFFLVTLWQSINVIRTVPKFPPLFSGFGAELPPVTSFIINYYWLGCAVVLAISLFGAAFLLLRPHAPVKQLKVAYAASLLALVGVFAWSGFALDAMYAPIFSLGQAV